MNTNDFLALFQTAVLVTQTAIILLQHAYLKKSHQRENGYNELCTKYTELVMKLLNEKEEGLNLRKATLDETTTDL